MQEPTSDAYAFLVVLFLPLIVWVISRPPIWRRIRPWLEPVGVRLWEQLVAPEPPDEGVLRSWATVRLEELRGHLERVRRLILDDAWMTATRQVANRMAFEHLVRDVREAEDTLSAYGPVAPWLAAAASTSIAAPRIACLTPPARPVVEVIEFGPTGRWR